MLAGGRDRPRRTDGPDIPAAGTSIPKARRKRRASADRPRGRLKQALKA